MRLSESFVIVVGTCAVGSHAASSLARSGVKKMRLVDPAILHQADLSCHALACKVDIGEKKAVVTRRALLRIMPVRVDHPT